MSTFTANPTRSTRQRRHRFVLYGGGLSVALVLAACGNGDEAGGPTDADDGSVSGVLTIYTGHNEEEMNAMAGAFAEAHGGSVTIETLNQPTEELMTTLELELQAGSPQADIIWADVAPVMSIAERYPDSLSDYVPAHADELIDGLVDQPDDAFLTPATQAPYAIMYNTDSIAEADVPDSFSDLTDERWNNQLVLADPRSATAVHPFIWFMTHHLTEADGYGWPWFGEVGALNPTLTSSHNTINDLVATGERPLAPSLLNGALTTMERGEPVNYVIPTEGAPVSVWTIGIIEGGPNQAAAEALVDFVTSAEGQEAIIEAPKMLPVREDVPSGLPGGEAIADLNLVPVDSVWIQENREEQMNLFHDQMPD